MGKNHQLVGFFFLGNFCVQRVGKKKEVQYIPEKVSEEFFFVSFFFLGANKTHCCSLFIVSLFTWFYEFFFK